MTKQKFESPEIEIIRLEEEDIIATSGGQNPWEDPDVDPEGLVF